MIDLAALKVRAAERMGRQGAASAASRLTEAEPTSQVAALATPAVRVAHATIATGASTRPGESGARVYLLSRAQADEAHSEAWGDPAIAAFTTRRDLLLRRGYRPDDADDLAEVLKLRDQRGDDLRMCIECSYLSESGVCHAAAMGRVPGAQRRFEPTPTVLQRCKAFGLRKGMP